jgi:3-polyprenyl-4-hydroxybenzoate decarboxylase
LGQPLPVTVFLGGPPALILAAIAPLPEDVPELVLASLLAGQKLKMTRNPLGGVTSARSGSRVCLVGHAPPHERRPKDHSAITTVTIRCSTIIRSSMLKRSFIVATRSIRRLSSANRVRKISSSATICRNLLSPLFPMVMPSVRDLWTYGETGFHSLCAAVVRERYGREALVSGFGFSVKGSCR